MENAKMQVQGKNELQGGARREAKRETRALALSGMLIGIGFVLHTVVPPLFFGIKPDFLLSCMFIAIAVHLDAKNALVTGAVAGIVAALTTGFPGGQIPSLLDKVFSALAVYAFLRLMPKNLSKAKGHGIFALACFAGTVFSGMIFLGAALMIAGLPAPFTGLMTGIVLPTAALNTVFGVVMYKLQERFK